MTSENNPATGRTDVALHTATFAEELARLAKSQGLDTLAYILDMAKLEADQIAGRWSGERRSPGPD